jgi:Fe-S cluster biogenesis protein NfuA
MDVKMLVQSTPNPNALKFVLNRVVKTEGKVSYKRAEDCADNPLAQKLFGIPHVSEVFFFDNYITITQDGGGDWDEIETKVRQTIIDNIETHDPNFKTPEDEARKNTPPPPQSPELQKIDMILNQTVRPALQADGGDLQVLGLNGNILIVNYQGACGSCPSATMGTLKAIENILRDEYNPDLVVELA